MNAAEIAAWTRANLRARLAYSSEQERITSPPHRHTCPVCARPHGGASRTCGACRQRAYRAKAKA